MEDILIFIHTLKPLIAVFDELTRQMLPGVTAKHILDEPLLEFVRQQGDLREEHAVRLHAHVEVGGEIGAKAVLVTCSTISPLVDAIRPRVKLPLFKIDEAMIEQAVQAGPKILVVATNPTTLAPTRQLLRKKAMSIQKDIQMSEILVEGALTALLAGDSEEHDRMVRNAIYAGWHGKDVVVLAQASMARVVGTLAQDKQTPPVMSSPHLAIARLKSVFTHRRT